MSAKARVGTCALHGVRTAGDDVGAREVGQGNDAHQPLVAVQDRQAVDRMLEQRDTFCRRRPRGGRATWARCSRCTAASASETSVSRELSPRTSSSWPTSTTEPSRNRAASSPAASSAASSAAAASTIVLSSDQIEDIQAAISEMGVQIVESDDEVESEKDEVEEEAAPAPGADNQGRAAAP